MASISYTAAMAVRINLFNIHGIWIAEYFYHKSGRAVIFVSIHYKFIQIMPFNGEQIPSCRYTRLINTLFP